MPALRPGASAPSARFRYPWPRGRCGPVLPDRAAPVSPARPSPSPTPDGRAPRGRLRRHPRALDVELPRGFGRGLNLRAHDASRVMENLKLMLDRNRVTVRPGRRGGEKRFHESRGAPFVVVVSFQDAPVCTAHKTREMLTRPGAAAGANAIQPCGVRFAACAARSQLHRRTTETAASDNEIAMTPSECSGRGLEPKMGYLGHREHVYGCRRKSRRSRWTARVAGLLAVYVTARLAGLRRRRPRGACGCALLESQRGPSQLRDPNAPPPPGR